MEFLELYENGLERYRKIHNAYLWIMLINVIVSILTKSFVNVAIALLIVYLIRREDKKRREIETLIFKVMPHDLGDDGYYKMVSEDYVKSYTYYYDKKEGAWIVEYRISETEAKIIKLNDFERFDFFSTERDYQPLLRIKHYELKHEVKDWLRKHPEVSMTLMPKKIAGELGFENIYED